MTDAAQNASFAEPRSDDALGAAADAVVEACDGDAKAAVRALLATNSALEREVARLSGKVSAGYTRGR